MYKILIEHIREFAYNCVSTVVFLIIYPHILNKETLEILSSGSISSECRD